HVGSAEPEKAPVLHAWRLVALRRHGIEMAGEHGERTAGAPRRGVHHVVAHARDGSGQAREMARHALGERALVARHARHADQLGGELDQIPRLGHRAQGAPCAGHAMSTESGCVMRSVKRQAYVRPDWKCALLRIAGTGVVTVKTKVGMRWL